jgi:hypothetical protein
MALHEGAICEIFPEPQITVGISRGHLPYSFISVQGPSPDDYEPPRSAPVLNWLTDFHSAFSDVDFCILTPTGV